MGKPLVHFDIGCRDKDQSRAFYEAVFGWKSEPYGPFSFKLDTGSPLLNFSVMRMEEGSCPGRYGI